MINIYISVEKKMNDLIDKYYKKKGIDNNNEDKYYQKNFQYDDESVDYEIIKNKKIKDIIYYLENTKKDIAFIYIQDKVDIYYNLIILSRYILNISIRELFIKVIFKDDTQNAIELYTNPKEKAIRLIDKYYMKIGIQNDNTKLFF
jgi:hypothetical protein